MFVQLPPILSFVSHFFHLHQLLFRWMCAHSLHPFWKDVINLAPETIKGPRQRVKSGGGREEGITAEWESYG